MPLRKPLSLNISLINQQSIDDDDDNHHDDNLCESTYRQEGLSIGADYLRIEGTTYKRDKFQMLLESTLGQGSCSKVMKAHWNNEGSAAKSRSSKMATGAITADKNTTVALKQFTMMNRNSDERKQLLATEVRTLANIQNECLVLMMGAYFQEAQNMVTVVLEYMDMGSLETILDDREPLSDPWLVSVGYQMLWGLSYLHHNKKMLHRDIKPSNVLLARDGRVKLTDFGVASWRQHNQQRQRHSNATNENNSMLLMNSDHTIMNTTVIGTTRYLSPERLRARPYNRAADMWGFGLVLLECVLGISPFESITSQIELLQTIEDEMNDDDEEEQRQRSSSSFFNEWIPSSINTELRQILIGCLQKKPEKRMPANILLEAPWFESYHVRCVPDAVSLLRASLP